MEQRYGDPGTTLLDMATGTNAALHANPFPEAPQVPSSAPPNSAPPNITTVTPAVPTPATDTRAMPAEWQQAYDNAPPHQLRTERYVPAKQPFVPGTHELAGEKTTINFQVREFTAPDGTPVRAYDLNLDLVSKNDAVTPQQRLDYGRAVQNTVNEMVNGRHTFPDGRQLQVNVTFNTLAWRDGMLNDWEGDPRRNPPIELVTDPAESTHQHQWNTNDSVAVAVHEIMHYLGDNEGYKSDERLLRTEVRPGVMGQDVHKLPVSRAEAEQSGHQDYLTAADLRVMQDVAQTAGPVRARPVLTDATTSVQTPSRAPVMVEKGTPTFREAQRRYRFTPLPGEPRRINPQLPDRPPATAGKPAYVATVPATVGTDIDALIDQYAQAFDNDSDRGRFALVIGVNGNTARDPDAARAIQDKIDRVTVDPAVTFPVVLTGFTWSSSATSAGDQRNVPYAAFRETLARHDATENLIADLNRQPGADPENTFLHIGDGDVESMRPGGQGLFDRADTVVAGHENAQMISGGYDLGPGRADHDGPPVPADVLARARTVNQADLQVRQAMAQHDSRSVYLPEPNTLLRMPPGGRLENSVTFGVRSNDSAALTYTSKEGRGIAESVAANRPWVPDPARNFAVFEPSLAVTTDGKRLLRNFPQTGVVPQSHIDPGTWQQQIENLVAANPEYQGVTSDHITDLRAVAFSRDRATYDAAVQRLTQARGTVPVQLTRMAAGTRRAIQQAGVTTRPAPTSDQAVRTRGTAPDQVARPVSSRAVDDLRTAQRDTAPLRVADTTAYDVVELPFGSGVPDVVVQSYLDAGLDAPFDAPARPQVGRVEGPVAYDHRVLTTDDGRRVRDFTVKLHLDPATPLTDAELRDFQQRVRAGVDATWNRGYAIGPDGDQLHVNVEFTGPADAHATVTVHAEGGRSTQTTWSTGTTELELAHEVGHFLGLHDEYADAAPTSPTDAQRVFHTGPDAARVHHDNSIMATTRETARPEVLRRHVDRIGALAEDIARQVPGVGTPEQVRRVELTVHTPDGESETFRPVGVPVRQKLDVTRTVDDHGNATYDLGRPTLAPFPGTVSAVAPAAPAQPDRVPGGLVYATPGDHVTRDTAAAPVYANRPDRYHVFGHGNQRALEVGPARVSAAQVAADIRADPAWHGQPIVLIACDTGVDRADGFAAQLARELPGTRIVAPGGIVWAGNSGIAMVTPTDALGPGDVPLVVTPSADSRFVEFVAPAETPNQVDVTDLPYVLDTASPLGDFDVDSLAASVGQLATNADAVATDIATVAQPSVDALAGVTTARDTAVPAAEVHQDARGLHNDLDQALTAITERADEAPGLARAAVDAGRSDPDFHQLARDAEQQVLATDAPVREALADAAVQAPAVRDFRDAAARADALAQQAAADLDQLQAYHDELVALRDESRQWADRAAEAARDAADARALPPGSDQQIRVADSFLRSYQALQEIAQRQARVDALDRRIAGLGDLPATVRDVRTDLRDADTLVDDAVALEPAAQTAHATAIDRLDTADDLLRRNEEMLNDVYDRADELGITIGPEAAPTLTPFRPQAPTLPTITEDIELDDLTAPAGDPDIGVAITTDGDLALPAALAPPNLRQKLPDYLRDSRTLGLAEQIGPTEGLDLSALAVPPAVRDQLHSDLRNDVDQFLGAGRPYPVVVNGRPAELVVTATLDWSGLRTQKASPDSAKASGKTDGSFTGSVRHTRDQHFEPKATVTAMPPLVAGAGASVPTTPQTSATTARRTDFSTVTSVKVDNQAEVTVPIVVTATLRDAGAAPLGTVTTTGTVPLRVPAALNAPDPLYGPIPEKLHAPLPSRFGLESLTSHTDPAAGSYFDQVDRMLREAGLGDITRVGAPGRTVLQRFLSDGNLSAKLAKAATHDPDDPDAGWVDSEPLTRAHESAWRRVIPGRDRALQMRLVARQVQVVETVAGAKHSDVAKLSVEAADDTAADRPWNVWGLAGGGTDVAPVSFVVGPRVSGSRKGANTQKFTDETRARDTLEATGPAVRYRTVYDLQVRPIGGPVRTLTGPVETLQWTAADRVRESALDPGATPWRGRTGDARTHFAPAHLENGHSFGGAYINDLDGGGKLYRAVADALRSVPGHRGFAFNQETFVKQFGDESLASGLSAGVQAILARDATARTHLSDRQLRFLLDRIVGPGLEIPLMKNGALHDYSTVVTVTGELSDLSDGELLDRGTMKTGDKRGHKSAFTGGQESSRTGELSVEGRVLGPVGRAISTVLGGPRVSHTRVRGHDLTVSAAHGSDVRHAPGLTADGELGDVPMREFAGTLTVRATSQSSVRPNQNMRQLLPGLPGRGTPALVSGSVVPPQEHKLDVRLLVPEHRVTTTRPDAARAPLPRDQEWMAYAPPLSTMTGGFPHGLDGSRVEAFLGTGHLQDAVKETLVRATGDPIFAFPDGPNSGTISTSLSPERLTTDRTLFSQPLAIDHLAYSRRSSDVAADVKVRFRPSRPQVLPAAEFEQVKDTLAGGSGSGAKRGSSWEVSASATAVTGLSGVAQDHGASSTTPGGAVVATVTPWQRTWGNVREQSVAGTSKVKVDGRPERRVPVRVDIDAEIVVEARRKGNFDRLGVFSGPPVQRAGQRLTLPESAVVWLTEDEVHQIRVEDAARDRLSAEVQLQQMHASQAEGQRDRHDAQRAELDARHRAANTPADVRQRELDELRARQDAERRTMADRQSTERQLVDYRHDERAAELDLARPPAVADPVTAGLLATPLDTRSIGIGGISSEVDLGNRVGAVREAVADAIGGTRGRQIADALLPRSASDQPHDNVRALRDFLSDARNHTNAALNGGRSVPLRLEGRFGGHTYQATLSAALGDPGFTGIEHVAELEVADKTTVTVTDTATRGRTLGGVSVTLRAQGTNADHQTAAEKAATSGHGATSETVGGGYQGTANLDVHSREETGKDALTYAQSLTVKGPVATYAATLALDVTVTGDALPDAGATVHDERPVTVRTHPGPARITGPTGVAGPVTSVPAAELTDDARAQWRSAAGHDTLPDSGQYAVEHVWADAGDLHRAAERALTASGATVDESTRAALRDTLSTTNLKAGLPAMLAGNFPVPVNRKTGRELWVEARLVPRPTFAGADADITVDSSVEDARSSSVTQKSSHAYAVKLSGPFIAAGAGHPGGASKIGDRHPFGAVSGSTIYEQPLYATDTERQKKTTAGLDDTKNTLRPDSKSDPDDKMTRSLSYGVEFRIVARKPNGDVAGVDLRIDDALAIRMNDAAARERTGTDLPPALRQTALDVAKRGEELAAAVKRRDGQRAQPTPDAALLADADRAVTTAETAWWAARNAHDEQLDQERRAAAAAPTPPLTDVPPAAVAKRTAETPTVGDPVDVTTGRVIYTETDLRLPGLTLDRTHRSDYRWGRSFGASWASTLDQRIVAGEDEVWFLAADGSVRAYPLPAEGDESEPVAGRGAPLRRLIGGGWLLAEGNAWLLFAPAGAGDAWLTDIAAPDVHWQIERLGDGTPVALRSSAGVEVELDVTGTLVTGGFVLPGEGPPVELPGFRYDDRRHLVGITNSSGAETRLDYDAAGRIARWEDRNGEWFTYAYDAAGRCVATDGRGGYLRYSFRYGDDATVVTDSLGHVTRYEFDDRLRVTAIVDPLGATTRFEWDSAGRLVARTDALGHVGRAPGVPPQAFDPDGPGRIGTITHPDATTTDIGWTDEGDLAWIARPDGTEQQWHYDGEGNLVEVTDATGRAVRLEYGPFDLPTARIDEMGNRTEFTYDTELRLATVVNPAGQVWSYRYDPVGRLREQTDFDGRTQRYVHDAAGRLAEHTDAAGVTTHYGYDALGRVVERRVGDNVTRLAYDAAGHVESVVNRDATVRFERDAEGRVVAETINGDTVRTSYDGDRVAARTTPSGRRSRWTFDAQGRPESLATGAHLLRFEHDAAGREISRTIGDLVALRQSFDAAGRLAAQHIASVTQDFAYDAADRITAIGDRSFAADDAGRIRTVTGAGGETEQYEYDAAGNLVGTGRERWELDGTMLVRSDDATFDYDAKGRLVRRVDTAGTWEFTWDAEDRMVGARTPDGERWRYAYDGFGRRIAKQRLGAGGEVLAEVRFAWSGDLMLEQSDGTTTTTWDYRPDGSAPVAQTDGDALHTVITDTVGTPTHLVAASGALSWWSRGDLWGRTPQGSATPLRFPGQYHDAETGLHYNRFRYYDPATARYVSPDPLGLSGGPNPTAYVTDPLRIADPLGLTSCKPAQPSLNPVAAASPVPDPATEPTSLPANANAPTPDSLYGMPVLVREDYVASDGNTYTRYVERDTPSPPPLSTPAGRMGSSAHTWYSDVAWAPASALRDPNSTATRSYDSVRSEMETLTGGRRPRTGPRSDRNLQFNEPMMGNRSYNRDSRGRDGIGEDIAAERDGGRRTAAQIANFLRGYTSLDSIGSAAGRDFASIVQFSERARGYDQEVNILPSTLQQIHSLSHSSDARRYWNNIGAWFGPARRGYAAEAYVPPVRQPAADQLITGERRPQNLQARDYQTVTVTPRRSRSPERRSGGSRRRDRSRSRYGFQGTQTGTPALDFAAPGTQSVNPAPLADQFAALDGNPQAQAQLLDSFRDQLSQNITLSDGSTLPVLAANVHGTTPNTDADLQTLNDADRSHLPRIRDGRAPDNINDCVPITLTVDNYKSTGFLAHVPPQTTPMPLSEVTSRYPGRTLNEVSTIRGLMDALGAMPNGTNGIVGLRPGAPGTTGHVINVAKDSQGRVTFEDGQSGTLATLPRIDQDGSVFLLQTTDPAPAPALDSDVEMTSPVDSDSDVSMADFDSDSDVDMGSLDFTPTPVTFADIAPEAVAKTTAETPVAGDPIDLTTGRMLLTHTDAELPGLTLERTYRSDYRWGRTFGTAWASTLDQRIIVDGEQVRYLAADGSLLTYPLPAEGETALPATGKALPLRRLVGGGWWLSDPTTGRSLLFASVTETEALLSDVSDAGVRWAIARDRRGTPTELRSSAGATVVFRSSGGLATTMLLPNAAGDLLVAAQFGYDGDRNLVSVTNSSGDPETFDYAGGRIVRWEDRNGEWYTYTYDEAGRCVATDGKGGYLRYRFDYQPGRTVVTDSLGAVRTYELNDRFQVVAETDALGATTRTEWDEAYRLRSHTDALGRVTAYEYDADGRPTATVRADGSRSTTTYDALGRAVSWTDFDGSTRNRQFDENGLMIAEVDANGDVVRFEQAAEDGRGTAIHVGPTAIVRNPARLVTALRTGDSETLYTYDALGRVFSVEDEQGITEFGWTLEGDLAWRENADGTVEEFLYDGEGNLVETVDRTGRRTIREYGAFDLVTAEIDHDGNRTEYAYDTELRLVTITNPAGETWKYTYDPNGRMVEETDFGGRTQRYAYDAAGQLVTHTNAAGEVTHYTYDVLGRVIERRTGAAVTQYTYDAVGRLLGARDANSEIVLERDALGRVVSETVNGNTVVTTYSEELGSVTARTRPSGAVTRWSYDESGRPVALAAGGQQLRFGYEGSREVSRSSDAGLSLQQAFDELGRLTGQRIAGVTDRQYGYDDTGRLTAVRDAVQGDRPVTASSQQDVRYTYDALGRPTTRTDEDGDWRLEWDHEDRLVAVTTPGGERWRYMYDAFGRRIAKQRLSAKGAVLEEAVFVWSGDLLVEQHHRTRAGVVSTVWEYHPGATHPIAQVTDGTLHTVVTDAAGAPMDVVGADGTRTGDAAATPLRAGGRYYDAETGLLYDRSRYFDAAAARFLPSPGTAPVPAQR
ncbi:DUF6531 domain-containing protein [Symbioplanes lichenis]|uniref:DUF6531 domain-containing protein n=1 Tax=Symbioplanes lichenis TaxID=1629072 RepID=UPI002738220D|nr:DUF6531 domain-containing protein [Actinoplanes lichenis]